MAPIRDKRANGVSIRMLTYVCAICGLRSAGPPCQERRAGRRHRAYRQEKREREHGY